MGLKDIIRQLEVYIFSHHTYTFNRTFTLQNGNLFELALDYQIVGVLLDHGTVKVLVRVYPFTLEQGHFELIQEVYSEIVSHVKMMIRKNCEPFRSKELGVVIVDHQEPENMKQIQGDTYSQVLKIAQMAG